MTHSKSLPSVERVQELLHYDPDSGAFTWKRRRGGKAKAGSPAGGYDSSGYLVIEIDRVACKAHRLAWLLSYAEDPGSLLIDHINRDRADNRIRNLRLVDSSGNNLNTVRWKGGVSRQRSGRWQARLWCPKVKRLVALGTYDTKAEAQAVATSFHPIFGT